MPINTTDITYREEKNDLDIVIKPNAVIGIRHLQVLLLFLGLVLAYAMRVCMSVGIVAMTSENVTLADVPVFPWPKTTQSTILSSFFWGYIFSQVPGGIAAERYGGKYPLLVCMITNAIVCVLIPIAAIEGGWGAVCACRVLQGFFQGCFYPSTHALLGKWAPPSERGRLGTLVYGGATIGTVITLPLAGVLCGGPWGWPSTFYAVGIATAVWSVVWFLLGANTPEVARFISIEERNYIKSSLGQSGERKTFRTPWKAILTCLPVWALVIVHCGQSWGFFMLLTEIPSYLNAVLGVDIKSNGLYSALPYLAMWILSFVFSFASDYIINRKLLSITAARKLSNSIGYWVPALTLIGLSYAPTDVTIAVTLLTITVGINAGHHAGFQLNHIDLAPNFAGILMGITNAAASFLAILAPLSVGLMLDGKDASEAASWRPIFFLSAAIYFLFNLFWVFFGTSNLQPWNDPDFLNNDDDMEKKNLNVKYELSAL